jgi:hypothetical protein
VLGAAFARRAEDHCGIGGQSAVNHAPFLVLGCSSRHARLRQYSEQNLSFAGFLHPGRAHFSGLGFFVGNGVQFSTLVGPQRVQENFFLDCTAVVQYDP